MLCTVAAFASIALASQPVLVSELLASGQPDRARNLSQINYKGVHMGWGGHYTAPAEHRSDRLNHIYTWYQQCTECNDVSSAPLLLWLQGGPGGPGWFGAFAEIGSWYLGGNTSDAEPHERCFSWCKRNNCLFVDQPVNTGFSFQTDKATGATITDVSQVFLRIHNGRSSLT